MKIAFTNSSNRLVAGAERYIESIAGFLQHEGHEAALWYENENPNDRQRFLPQIFPSQHSLESLGIDAWIRTLEEWEPDLIFGHGLYDPQPEAETLKIAPSVYFAHNYHGTCISGQKCQAKPGIKACSRKFGPACLVMFYPRRCGGLNPVTLIKDYQRTQDRLAVIARYSKVVTHTAHMEAEYWKHGISCEAISQYSISHPLQVTQPFGVDSVGDNNATWNLLFIGRMVELKGGGVFLDSLPAITRNLQKPIKVCFAGDGPSRESWESRARVIERDHPHVKVEFTGWISGERLESVISEAHLHVLPSLWPEPFGMSGLELGLRSIPTVAFRVGGVPDWLRDGVNGILAENSHPAVGQLADAVVASLRDRKFYAELRSGARRVATSMTFEKHCASLMKILDRLMVGDRAGVCAR